MDFCDSNNRGHIDTWFKNITGDAIKHFRRFDWIVTAICGVAKKARSGGHLADSAGPYCTAHVRFDLSRASENAVYIEQINSQRGSCLHDYSEALGAFEHVLAKVPRIGIQPQIVKFSGVDVVGLNNNDYQIERATKYAKQEKLDHKLTFTKGDFMQMPYPDNSFDAVYAIEATVHAPSLEGIYTEIHRVLKPGGVFGVYEWLMKDAYDNDNPQHREIRLGIEQGDGISNMEPIPVAIAAMKAAGFQMEVSEDMADRPDEYPWYWPLSGELKYMQSIWDFPTLVRMTHIGRGLVHRFVGALEMIRFAPRGTQKTADSLALAADCLVAGGKQKLFTPMYLMVGRKAKA
ncbi:hypothetical protein B0A55_01506 [Friedmanniomyces simplex]|uniref:Sterol 24-C-methyltransferase n=1 Tax=Friedmanniomyces simplex TaxID=329884 RepID=A0A4U0Y3D4_9PEZI|nr:hypothetical protein B0A55_01506 [Friedmanniomyces simplex]